MSRSAGAGAIAFPTSPFVHRGSAAVTVASREPESGLPAVIFGRMVGQTRWIEAVGDRFL
jgi:hypothetical protein